MILQNAGLVMIMLCLIPSVSAVHPSNVLLGFALSLCWWAYHTLPHTPSLAEGLLHPKPITLERKWVIKPPHKESTPVLTYQPRETQCLLWKTLCINVSSV